MSEGIEKAEIGEKRAQIRVSPNFITLLRIFLLPLPCALLFIESYLAKVFSLGLGSILGFTDYVDGVLARRQKKVTRIGAMLDPVADKIFVTVVYLSLVYLGYFPFAQVALLISRELLVSFLRSWFTEDLRVINIARYKTAFQMILAGLAIGLSLIKPELIVYIHYALWLLVVFSWVSAIPYFYRVKRAFSRTKLDPLLFAKSLLSLALGLTLLIIFPLSGPLFPIIQVALSFYFFRKGLARTSPLLAQQESLLILGLLILIAIEINFWQRVFYSLFLVLLFSLYRDGLRSLKLVWEILRLK